MNNKLTCITYHYVRDVEHADFPAIKGLDIDAFIDQLDYIESNYHIISGYDLIRFLTRRSKNLPDNAAMLTFDDGLRDHYDIVYPILASRNLSGAFFPPAKAIMTRRLLNVHKLHILLASLPNTQNLYEHFCEFINHNRTLYGLKTLADYKNQWYKPGLYGDPPETIFIKNMLQKGLAEPLRTLIIDELCCEYVDEDLTMLGDQWYLNTEQVQEMYSNGMYIGGHGYEHAWMDNMTRKSQQKDVSEMLGWFEKIGILHPAWIMCYPHGAVDHSLINTLKDNGCVAGLTIEAAQADFSRHQPHKLPRYDTNLLPEYTRFGIRNSFKKSMQLFDLNKINQAKL